MLLAVGLALKELGLSGTLVSEKEDRIALTEIKVMELAGSNSFAAYFIVSCSYQ